MLKSTLKNLYHYYAPQWMKNIYRRKMFADEYRKFIANGVEKGCEQETDYIRRSKIPYVIPYKWVESYRVVNYKIHRDDLGFYCKIGDKKLYVPTNDGSYSEGIARVIAEQDKRSPHMYFDHHVLIDENSVLFDIGAAEGLITLLNIDKVKKAYVFECDEQWCSALKKTFAPYGDKVSIINKFVSDVNDDNNTTLEPFLRKHIEDNVILKMDIEGMETQVLQNGLGSYVGAANLKFSCCTYHRVKDAEILKDLFEREGYLTEFTQGYILFMNEKPYFRTGVIRAWKE